MKLCKNCTALKDGQCLIYKKALELSKTNDYKQADSCKGRKLPKKDKQANLSLTKTLRKPKMPAKSKLCELADDLFQTWIRMRDNYICCTCPPEEKHQFGYGERTELHGGHYYSRGKYAIRYNESNCHAQCAKCNMLMNYNNADVKNAYDNFMVGKYGANIFEELKSLMRKEIKTNNEFYLDIIREYKDKVSFKILDKKNKKTLDYLKQSGII